MNLQTFPINTHLNLEVTIDLSDPVKQNWQLPVIVLQVQYGKLSTTIKELFQDGDKEVAHSFPLIKLSSFALHVNNHSTSLTEA